MELTIEEVRCWLVDIPTIRPHKLSMATMGSQTLMLVQIRCQQGIVGWGEGTTIGGLSYGPESPEAMKLTIERYITPLLLGQPLSGVTALSEKLAAVRGNSFAKSAIETAFLDAYGKYVGLPMAALLGGARHQRLPALWTLASGDTDNDLNEAHRLLETGRHHAFKLKIGARDLETDVNHAVRIKQTLGEHIHVHVDVNQGWSMAQALSAIPRLQAAGITLIEQPIALTAVDQLIDLAKRFPVTLLADEAVTDAQQGLSLIRQGFSGAFALKIAKAGGPFQALKLAHVAQAAGISLYGGTMLEGSIGTIASLHAWSTLDLEWGTEMFGPLLLKDDVITQPLIYKDGHLSLPTGHGLGIDVDQDKLAYYARK
ncbi:muconate/chloromuconate family cycloisomerase [Rosenbergiella australiborealis]|uniref:Muconate cycloisomerase n=1 Tax=Rosenbergiella australiborealis TaxID=1544696 RepID=A0ABS5T4T2_9GAMM|nr:muconate/chloromuconate family cycloisomerase [Rosenbergiella australiborealis]MBT0726437.1 muconate cycloisomerase [Rosenbergiella australiborealis]